MGRLITGRICEDIYLSIRHCCFHILIAINFPWLPFIRQVEKQLKTYKKHLIPKYTIVEKLGLGFIRPMVIFFLPVLIIPVLSIILELPLLVQGMPDYHLNLTGILKIIGTILATLTAILLAVIALAIQTTQIDLPGAKFLLRTFARKQGFIPIAALLFGTLITITAGIILADTINPQNLILQRHKGSRI